VVRTQGKIMMQTTRVNVNRKPVVVGVLKKFWAPGPLIEAPSAVREFNREHRINAKLIRPTTAECLLVKTSKWGEVRSAFPSPVGMIIAYEKPEKKFGSEVVFETGGEPRVVIATGRFKGEKNIALVAMDITADDLFKDGNDVIVSVPKKRIVVVPEFPARDGWYKPHKSTTIPHGEKIKDSSSARHLMRADTSYVGFPVCDCSGVNVPGLNVGQWPLRGSGIAVEIPKGEMHRLYW